MSAETIYQSLYVESRGALKRELTACLRTGRALRTCSSAPGSTAVSRVTANGEAVRRQEVPVRAGPAVALWRDDEGGGEAGRADRHDGTTRIKLTNLRLSWMTLVGPGWLCRPGCFECLTRGARDRAGRILTDRRQKPERRPGFGRHGQVASGSHHRLPRDDRARPDRALSRRRGPRPRHAHPCERHPLPVRQPEQPLPRQESYLPRGTTSDKAPADLPGRAEVPASKCSGPGDGITRPSIRWSLRLKYSQDTLRAVRGPRCDDTAIGLA